MILITLVSLSSYCQYPITKIIGKDTVVIMTLKQGQEINSQFSILKDSLSTKNNTLVDLKKQFRISEKSFDDSVNVFKSRIIKLNQENLFLSEEKKRVERQIWSDRRERRFTSIGILFATMGWFTLYIISK